MKILIKRIKLVAKTPIPMPMSINCQVFEHFLRIKNIRFVTKTNKNIYNELLKGKISLLARIVPNNRKFESNSNCTVSVMPIHLVTHCFEQ